MRGPRGPRSTGRPLLDGAWWNREIDLDGASQTAQFADGHYMNAGPARIPQHHTTLDYCRELGVAIEPFANANADAYLLQRVRARVRRSARRPPIATAGRSGRLSRLRQRVARQGD